MSIERRIEILNQIECGIIEVTSHELAELERMGFIHFEDSKWWLTSLGELEIEHADV